jgi:tRNA A37 methylthiotransferase MiaB
MATRTQEVRTFGCKINVHDSERIAGLLDEAGYGPETGVDGRTAGFRARGSW